MDLDWLIDSVMFSISDQYFSFINDCTLVCKWWYRMSLMVMVFLTPLSTIFHIYRGGHFYWCRKPEDPEKTTVNDKPYHIILYTSPWVRFELTTSVVISTDCIGSCTPMRLKTGGREYHSRSIGSSITMATAHNIFGYFLL
jgi:hypothetical protein